LTPLTSTDAGQAWSTTGSITGWISPWPAGDLVMLHPSAADPGADIAVVESSPLTHGDSYASSLTRDLGQSWSLSTEPITAIGARSPAVLYSAWDTTCLSPRGRRAVAHVQHTMLTGATHPEEPTSPSATRSSTLRIRSARS
jgi:hypothetical protein